MRLLPISISRHIHQPEGLSAVKDLNLNDLLRYGFAGAVFILVSALAYQEPASLLLSKDISGALAAASSAAALTIGCVIYALHRAVPYPLLYWLFRVLNGRLESSIELDLRRWRNSGKAGALQPRLADWAAQVHFLYCVAWASLLALLLGSASVWTPTSIVKLAWWAFFAMLTAAAIHHFRYQRWEKRVFEEDANVPG